jgi:hypothetical protein
MNETDSRGRRITSYVEAEVASGEVEAERTDSDFLRTRLDEDE